MIKFLEYIESELHQIDESFYNFLPSDKEERRVHATQLHDLVKKAYRPVGGIKGTGFSGPTDIANNIPLIKTHKIGNRITAASFYKDTGAGRKRVAIASDGSPEGKRALGRIVRDDLKQKRAFAEQSGPSLKFLHKQLNADDIKSFAIHPDKVKAMMPNDEFRDVPHDDPHLTEYSHLRDHFYQRKIGGEWKTKVSLGTDGIGIHDRP